jgi:hypothetical protein
MANQHYWRIPLEEHLDVVMDCHELKVPRLLCHRVRVCTELGDLLRRMSLVHPLQRRLHLQQINRPTSLLQCMTLISNSNKLIRGKLAATGLPFDAPFPACGSLLLPSTRALIDATRLVSGPNHPSQAIARTEKGSWAGESPWGSSLGSSRVSVSLSGKIGRGGFRGAFGAPAIWLALLAGLTGVLGVALAADWLIGLSALSNAGASSPAAYVPLAISSSRLNRPNFSCSLRVTRNKHYVRPSVMARKSTM